MHDIYKSYLLPGELRQEARHGPIVWVGRQEGWPVEGLVDVLDDDNGLDDGAVVVEEDMHELVDKGFDDVVIALVVQIL